MDVAATMLLLGLPGLRYLDSEDREERLLLYALVQRAVHVFEVMQKNQAAFVVNALAKAIR